MAATHMTNPLATVDQLYRRASYSAMPTDLQDLVFFATQRLTQAAGILLRLPQSVTAQANVLLARYWLVESPLADEFSDVSAASLFLVAKLSAHPCPPRDVCNVYAYLLSSSSALGKGSGGGGEHKSNSNSNEGNNSNSNDNNNTNNTKNNIPANDPSSYYLSESAYAEAHNRILALEGRILCALGFDTHVALPHGLAVTYLQALDFFEREHHPSSTSTSQSQTESRAALAGRTTAYLNAALLSPQLLYLTHQPHALAVAAVYAAARDAADAKMPECPWWEVFDVDREELGFLVVAMRSVRPWARRLADSFPDAAAAPMVARDFVEAEMRRRGLAVANGGGGASVKAREKDEEEAMLRRMDETAVPMEE